MAILLGGLGLCVLLCTLIRWTLFRKVAYQNGRAVILYPNLYLLLIQVICGSVIDGLQHQSEGIGFFIVSAATVECYALWLHLKAIAKDKPAA